MGVVVGGSTLAFYLAFARRGVHGSFISRRTVAFTATTSFIQVVVVPCFGDFGGMSRVAFEYPSCLSKDHTHLFPFNVVLEAPRAFVPKFA